MGHMPLNGHVSWTRVFVPVVDLAFSILVIVVTRKMNAPLKKGRHGNDINIMGEGAMTGKHQTMIFSITRV
jgi:hypothetical protein